MVQRVIVWNENHVKVGNTFPRRAKQLVSKKKAKWLDKAHTEILLVDDKKGGLEVNPQIVGFADELFKDIPNDSNNHNLKEVVVTKLNEKYEALIADGMDKDKAIEAVTKSVGNVNTFVKKLLKEKSIVKDAYRDSVDVVLRSSPIAIIKKSKRRTRELHTAFSLVLWTGTAIVFFAINYLLGYRTLTWRPSEITWTWLIFVFAALVECFVEIYFCKKELEVLNENIDLRQINPAKGGDWDLRGYQKRLVSKIRFMSYAVLWIPLSIAYFISGYMFNLWKSAWVVFLIGVFFELLRNFLGKLKEKAD